MSNELILVVADEHTVDFAVNLLLNLKEHGFAHHLLVTTTEGLCDKIRQLHARVARFKQDMPTSYAPLEGAPRPLSYLRFSDGSDLFFHLVTTVST